MKHAKLWAILGLLVLLCVGTVLALYASGGETPLLPPAETVEPEQSAAQPAETGSGAAPDADAAPSAPVASAAQPEAHSETPGDAPEASAEPTEHAVPVPGESVAPAPGESPAPGQSHTPRPGVSHSPAPQDGAAPTPGVTPAPATAPPSQSPSGTAAPTAPATQSPAANPAETAAPTTPLPTLPVSSGAKTQDEIRINELYASINALRGEATAELAALADQAEAEWLAIRDKHPSRKEFVLKYFDQATELEEYYDAQVDTLCNELQYLLTKTGGDTSVVREIRTEYEAEKESARAAYYRRFMALLDLEL